MQVRVFFLYLFVASWVYPYTWVGLHENTTKYLLAPGFCMSERNAAYYCDHYHAKSGEVILSKSSMEVLPSSCSSFNFPEVCLTEKSVSIISRLLSRVQQLALCIHDWLRETAVQGSYDQHTVARHWINIESIDLGQEKDVAILSSEYDQLENTNSIVLYGISRGAATTFIFMSSEYYNKSAARVKLVILEGCYDTLFHVFDHISGVKHWVYERFAERYLPAFIEERIEPIDFVGKFPRDVPILFVTSAQDTTVSSCCTKTLCNKLVESGHQQVYLVELHSSGHIGYFCHNKEDVEKYQSTVHALYKFYNLPYIEEYAQKGEVLLEEAKQD